MNTLLTNSHVIITGATRGVGHAIACVFHQAGARVSLMARYEADLHTFEQELGERCAVHAADIRHKADIESSLNHFRAVHGPVDILINNAAVGAYRPFIESSEEEIVETIEVNLMGLVMMTHAVIKEMVERRRGQVIHIASDLGRKPLANMAVYSATKHAVVGFSQSLAREVKEFGVKSIVLTPGIIDTSFGGRNVGDRPPPGALRADEVAQAVLFVASQPPNVLIDELTMHALGQEF